VVVYKAILSKVNIEAADSMAIKLRQFLIGWKKIFFFFFFFGPNQKKALEIGYFTWYRLNTFHGLFKRHNPRLHCGYV